MTGGEVANATVGEKGQHGMGSYMKSPSSGAHCHCALSQPGSWRNAHRTLLPVFMSVGAVPRLCSSAARGPDPGKRGADRDTRERETEK